MNFEKVLTELRKGAEEQICDQTMRDCTTINLTTLVLSNTFDVKTGLNEPITILSVDVAHGKVLGFNYAIGEFDNYDYVQAGKADGFIEYLSADDSALILLVADNIN